MIKVLVVDDSAVVRQGLSDILAQEADMEVIGTAGDPFIAAEKMRALKPDVITLDIEMPRMDGLTFLRKIMSQHPIPVVICSSLVAEHSDTLLRALEYGAVDIILKPKLGTKAFLHESRQTIADAIRGAAQAKVKVLLSKKVPAPKLTADAVLPALRVKAMAETTEKVVVVGASTGGTEAIRVMLQSMPADCPAIAIVQHMPEGFTRSFAGRLNQLCKIQVKEAESGDTLLRGHALIAPGNRHMLIKRSGARYFVELRDGPLVSRHRPAVNVLFRSAAQHLGANAIAVMLTGMGDDGADGMLEMKQAGAATIGQDEATSVVYGMPKEAFKRGAVDVQLPLEEIATKVLSLSFRR